MFHNVVTEKGYQQGPTIKMLRDRKKLIIIKSHRLNLETCEYLNELIIRDSTEMQYLVLVFRYGEHYELQITLNSSEKNVQSALHENLDF